MSDERPVPGPTREQIAEAVDEALNGEAQQRHRGILNASWHRTPSDDLDTITDAVLALLPARPAEHRTAAQIIRDERDDGWGDDEPVTRWTVDEYETSRVDGPDDYRIRCYEANGTEFSPDLAQRVAAALNGLLPARPSPTDDDLRRELRDASIRAQRAEGHAERLGVAVSEANDEIARLRAHQGTT